jgi:hypothetical protein
MKTIAVVLFWILLVLFIIHGEASNGQPTWNDNSYPVTQYDGIPEAPNDIGFAP